MTIDEAIKQFKEDAEYNRADLDLSWAEENEQVAEWLEELKAIKEGAVFYSNRPIEDIVLEARADAIEEFESLLYQFGHFEPFARRLVIYEEDLEKLVQQLKEQK